MRDRPTDSVARSAGPTDRLCRPVRSHSHSHRRRACAFCQHQQARVRRDERAVQAPATRLIFLRLGPKGSEQLPREGHAEAGSSGGGCVSLLRNSSVTVVTVECAGAPTDRPTCGRVECDECGTDRPTRWGECAPRVGDSVTVRGAERFLVETTLRGRAKRSRLIVLSAPWHCSRPSTRG